MRTTLDIDADVLQAAKEIAANRQTTIGAVVSDWGRQVLAPRGKERVRNGARLIQGRPGSPMITMELVNRLRDED